ncbi:MAG: hypothetical protein EZS28_018919 [Streblomastix strix]|uniref:NrS-1 polymerase-like helicase domain-containing protein n=1 Tax=Streblomastix strix TaxID=222440 RepID=A0A5J4VSG5_9EUKA|nr:MAG: hypothetical protein EZS28_018919 [Streblomastix strix]
MQVLKGQKDHLFAMIQTYQNEILAYYLYSCDLMDYSTQLNVGKKTETVTVLKGLQGKGMNVFINDLCEQLAGYSSKNITDIDDFVDKFNTAIENKMLIFTNEMKNFQKSIMSHKDAIKSIITEDQLLINEKHIPKYEIENSGRRYVVCKYIPVPHGDLKDVSQFNPRDKPITQAKKEIIRASLSPVDDIIINHLEIKLHAILLKDGNNMI